MKAFGNSQANKTTCIKMMLPGIEHETQLSNSKSLYDLSQSYMETLEFPEYVKVMMNSMRESMDFEDGMQFAYDFVSAMPIGYDNWDEFYSAVITIFCKHVMDHWCLLSLEDYDLVNRTVVYHGKNKHGIQNIKSKLYLVKLKNEIKSTKFHNVDAKGLLACFNPSDMLDAVEYFLVLSYANIVGNENLHENVKKAADDIVKWFE